MATRIAVIEDEPALRDNLRDALTRHGYEVQTFAGRPAAQQALAARLPDLAIIDVGLGDEPEGGFELCRWLRARAGVIEVDTFIGVEGVRAGAVVFRGYGNRCDPHLARGPRDLDADFAAIGDQHFSNGHAALPRTAFPRELPLRAPSASVSPTAS